MATNEPLIPKHGGYRKLKSFQLSQLAYDMTVRFCDPLCESPESHPRPDGAGGPQRPCRTSPRGARPPAPRRRAN